MPDTVKLRGHHLLCILNYGGAGYTAEFVANMTAVIERINHGAPIEIVAGPDAICGALRQGGKITCDHARTCHSPRVTSRDAVALKEAARALQMPDLKTGSIFVFDRKKVSRMRKFFARNAIRKGCVRCQWHQRCSERAANHYAGAKLFPPETI